MDGQAELTWVPRYIPEWFTHLPTVTHPSINRAQRWLTSLMRPVTLPTKLIHQSTTLNMHIWVAYKQHFNTYSRRVCINGRRQTSHALPLVSDINWKLWPNSADCGLRSMMKSPSEASVNLYRGCPCRNLDSSVNWLGIDVACVNSRHQFTQWDHGYRTPTGNQWRGLFWKPVLLNSKSISC